MGRAMGRAMPARDPPTAIGITRPMPIRASLGPVVWSVLSEIREPQPGSTGTIRGGNEVENNISNPDRKTNSDKTGAVFAAANLRVNNSRRRGSSDPRRFFHGRVRSTFIESMKVVNQPLNF